MKFSHSCYSWAVLLLVAILALVWFFSRELSTQSIDESSDAGETHTINGNTSNMQKSTQATGAIIDGLESGKYTRLSPKQKKKLEQSAALEQKKIDELVLAYDKHLADPEMRTKIEEQVELRMKEYNQLILPLALDKMAQD